jgi:hypothetical protein
MPCCGSWRATYLPQLFYDEAIPSQVRLDRHLARTALAEKSDRKVTFLSGDWLSCHSSNEIFLIHCLAPVSFTHTRQPSEGGMDSLPCACQFHTPPRSHTPPRGLPMLATRVPILPDGRLCCQLDHHRDLPANARKHSSSVRRSIRPSARMDCDVVYPPSARTRRVRNRQSAPRNADDCGGGCPRARETNLHNRQQNNTLQQQHSSLCYFLRETNHADRPSGERGSQNPSRRLRVYNEASLLNRTRSSPCSLSRPSELATRSATNP